MKEESKSFSYSYSSAEQKEIEEIRKKYVKDTASEQISKMEQLRKLDSGVTSKATTIALCVGVICALIMGFGMSLIMTDLGARLGMSETFLVGIVIGVIGMLGVIAAYPLYQCVLKKEREKIAPQILKLTDELAEK